MATTGAAPLLTIEGLCKSFFGVQVLHDVGLALRPGEVLGLVGENGSGKSTTMNILGGVHQPDRGAMTIDGQPYAPRGPRDAEARGIAFIHQELNLFKNLTIEENLFIGGFPKLVAGLPFIDRRKVRERAQQLLKAIDLDLAPTTPVGRLSQGERQLVEIAKALGAEARHRHLRRADHLADRARERAPVRPDRPAAGQGHRDHLHQPHPGRRAAPVRPHHRAARRARGRQCAAAPR